MTIDTRIMELILAPETKLLFESSEIETKIYFTKDESNKWILNWKIDFYHYECKNKWFIFWKFEKIKSTIRFMVPWDNLNGSKELKDKIWYEYGLKGDQQ